MLIAHSKPMLDEADVSRVSEVIQSGYIAQGQIVNQFEKEMANFIGLRNAVATSSGTAALHLGLVALGIRRGDEVILPSYVCSAILNSINYTGATARLCDIHLGDFNISVEDIKRKINKKTKVIIVPHMFGMPAEMNKLLEFGIPLIEDCAHSIGASYKNRKVGTFGIFSIFSFYATKMLTAGEGGMVLSNSIKLINKIKDMRDYDKKSIYKLRYNYKMTDLQAALGLNQLRKLPYFIRRRRQLAAKFTKHLSSYCIDLPTASNEKASVFYRYIIRIKRADNLIRYISLFKKRGISVERPIYKPLHRYLALKGFPNTEEAYNTSISLPFYPALREDEINKILNVAKDIFT